MYLFRNPGLPWFAVSLLYVALQPLWGLAAAWAAGWSGRSRALLAAVRREPYGSWLQILGRALYSLVLPYGALLLGLADARRLGLAGLPYWPQLPVGALVGLAGVALLAWSWGRVAAVSYRSSGRHRLFQAEWQAFHTPWGWAMLVLEVICLQMSWALVRGAATRLFGLYAGVFLGLALPAAAWLLRPGRAAGLAEPEPRAKALLIAGLAIVTALAFLYGENLWLCAAVHGLGLVAATLAAGRAYAEAEA